MADVGSSLLFGILTTVLVTVATGIVYALLVFRSRRGSGTRQRGVGGLFTFRASPRDSFGWRESPRADGESDSEPRVEPKLMRQKAVIREIESRLTEDQVEEERRIQRRQLEEIFKLMAEHKERFGVDSVDDVRDQMKLYI